MIDFTTYKVKQGQYGGIIDSTVTLPCKLKLITDDNPGSFMHVGNHHYLGIMKGDVDEVDSGIDGLHCYIMQFGEYVIITINDIQFVDDYPDLVTADELNKEFDLSKYFIVTWDKDMKLLNMRRILRINSEFELTVSEVSCTDRERHCSTDSDMQLVDLGLDDIINDNCVAVVQGKIAIDYWNTLIKIVFEQFEYHINSDIVDIDYASQLFKTKQFDKLQDYLCMKRAKYITKYN